MKNKLQAQTNLLVLAISILITFYNVKAQVPQEERQALIDLYNATNGANWTNTKANNKPWLINDPNSQVSNWYGIQVAKGKVVSVELTNNNLNGVLPKSFENLKYLQTIHLGSSLTIRPEVTLKPATQTPEEIEREALIAFYKATNGDNWKNTKKRQKPWLINDPNSSIRDWHGVTVKDGRVIYIMLQNNNLEGVLVSDIEKLTSLEYLFLDENKLTGSIPTEIGKLTNLQILALHKNQLTGSIPSEIENLTKLVSLHINVNNLTGSIPKEIGQLVDLKEINLSNNQLTGSLPSELGLLHKMENLWVQENQLTGNIPSELGNLTKLKYLHLNNNQLTGEIPSELGQLNKLVQLSLNNNQFTGEIPLELSNLSLLTVLRLSNNQLSGIIPTNIKKIKYLDLLTIADNNFVFSDFESDYNDYQAKLGKNFEYIPQLKVDKEETKEIGEGKSITLTSTKLTSLNNTYQWYKDGNAITGEINKELKIDNVTESDTGTYHLVASNSIVKGLKIERNPIHLQVKKEDKQGIYINVVNLPETTFNILNGTEETNDLATGKPSSEYYIEIKEDNIKTIQINVEPSQEAAPLNLQLIVHKEKIISVEVNNNNQWLILSEEFYKIEDNKISFINNSITNNQNPFSINLINGVQYQNTQPLVIEVFKGIDITAGKLEIITPQNSTQTIAPDISNNTFNWDGTTAAAGSYQFVLEIENKKFKGHFLIL